MTLTPLQKFLALTAAGLIAGANLVWAGIQVDALALGLNEHIYNIGTVVLSVLNTGVVGLLALLGLRAPTKEEDKP